MIQQFTNQNRPILNAWIVRGMMLCLASTLLLATGCRQQTAKWNFAKAMNLAEAGQLEEAIELMEIALEQAPDDSRIKLSLASLLAENGQGELGIGHCDEYLETNPHDVLAHEIRSTCLQYLGRFDLSLCDYKRCLSGRVARTVAELNNLAYYRALARKELAKAAQDIQQAIESEEGENWGCKYPVPMQVRTAVAAGLISRHIQQHTQVLVPLNAKIEQYERKFATQDSNIKSLITELMQAQSVAGKTLNLEIKNGQSIDSISDEALYALDLHDTFPFGKKMELALLNARGIKQVQKNCLGVMLATRALIREDMKCHRSADIDRHRVEELGFDFSEMAQSLPSDEACLTAIWKACLFLDTRGFVSGRREWAGEMPLEDSAAAMDPTTAIAPSNYIEALEDLDFAVLAAQSMELALNSTLYNSPEVSVQQVEKKKKFATRMTAVLLYHRMEVHLRAGNKTAADRDQLSIEQLGFEPGASLF